MALRYYLNDGNFTIYHRAALGGLAATITAWEDNPPEGIQTTVESDFVEITWDESLTEQEALGRILEASFKLTEDKLIDLPGQFIGEDAADLKLAIHEGLCLTFLQHNKMRPGEKTPRVFPLKNADSENPNPITYKAINSYAHQKAQGTGLLDVPRRGEGGNFPISATIPQSVIPGAMTGKKPLQATPDEAILLLYLMVGCAVFLLRPRTYKEKAQACIVVPDVTDLLDFANSMQILASSSQNFQRFSNTYLGRVVGGAEEAALSFLIDIKADAIADTSSGVSGCQVIAMGKVAWDKNQINRSLSVKVRGNYPEMKVFRTAKQYLGVSKILQTKDGKSYPIPKSPVPELIAANLAAERHWCAYFTTLVSKKQDFNRMLFQKECFKKMAKAIHDEDDQAIIKAFHKAWEITMGQLGERARENNLDFSRLVEVRREKMRNEILRTKTPSALASWFLQFCINATKGAALDPIREDKERIRNFIFNQRNFDRFQNLLLFALLSYAGDSSNNKNTGDK
ncbi:type I-MYXAN CRISPR-associated Cas8a1/Cmx1 [Nostoc sp. FACHB-190]|uniref:type I-MYXAN CRISPR-associated Cas8a1/Cmx1 n=1 Tax=Nostoc sp. FACHB-190 TaxID=2692838 RepID=UPI0016890BE2|nr:type I-MYXAN CRISPR-associated Cas8a1/Cmx1 [Nostoc sp. FACHB-190]MBD2301542.1 type I-MYXAN CRISPR-associated Cas8a1/Cmx1 [Nostoc sp. FACHB-190]